MATSLYNRIVQSVVYLAAVLVPLFYLPVTSGPLEANKQMLLVVLASVGLVAWLLGVVVQGTLTVRGTPVDKGMLGLVLAAAITAVFSLSRSISIFGRPSSASAALVSVIALAILYFLAVNTLHDRGRTLRNVLTASLALTLLIGLCQMMTWYFLPGAMTHSRAFNTVGSLNALGVLAAVALPLFAKFAARAGSGRGILSVAGVALSVVILAILNWWTLWAVALAGMLGMIAFDSLNVTQLADDYGGKRNRFALSRFMVPLVVIVLGAVLLLVRFDVSSVRRNFPTEIAPTQRLSAQVTAGVLKQRPLVGFGPENFSMAFDRLGAGTLANTQLASWRFPDAASEAFNTAAQSGAVGLVALVLLAWCLLQVLARFGGAISESVARGDGAAFAMESSGTFAALIAMIAAFFLYPSNLTLAFTATVLLALAGLVVAGERAATTDIERRPLYSLTASLGFIVGLILVLTGVYFVSVRYLADVRYAAALSKKQSPQDAMTGVIRAIDLSRTDDRYLRDASQLALVLVRTEAANTTDTSPEHTQRIQNLVASAIQLAQRAVAVAPGESLNWANLATIYQSLTGVIDRVEQLSEDAYRKASELRPGDPTFDNSIGMLWMTRADSIRRSVRGTPTAAVQTAYADALTHAADAFRRAIDLSPTYGMALYNLGAVYDRQGKVNEAVAQLERVAPYNANEPTLMFELGLLYIRAGKKDNATAALQRAVLLAPQYANARWYLALLLEDKGDLPGALVQLQAIAKDNPDNTALQTKITQVEAGTRPVPPVPVIDNQPIQ